MTASSDAPADRAAVLGLLGCVPALLLVGAGLTFSLTRAAWAGRLTDLTAYPPALVLGGLAVALALNAPAVLRLATSHDDDAWAVVVTVRRRAANLAVGALALMLLGVLLLFAFGEAFAYAPH